MLLDCSVTGANDESFELTPDPKESSSDSSSVRGGLGSNVEVVGNRIQLAASGKHRSPSPTPSFTQFGRGYRHDGILHIKHEELRS